MIRVVLPLHLRTLANVVDGEVKLDVAGRATSARFSTRSKPAIRCCAERSAITSRSSADRSCGSSRASKICPTSRRMRRCPTRSRQARSPFSSWGPLPAAKPGPKARGTLGLGRFVLAAKFPGRSGYHEIPTSSVRNFMVDYRGHD